ncbi:hypothetical protein [Ligilactobacillus salivarius]|uniref:hypothetical protein n=1 Tax=Ligilactobacillus salivarius TaxID=1624 RepID=UPI0039933435
MEMLQSIVEGFNQYLSEEPLDKFTEYVQLFKEYLIKSASRKYEQYIKQKLEDILNNLHSTYKTQDLLGNLIEVKKRNSRRKNTLYFSRVSEIHESRSNESVFD